MATRKKGENVTDGEKISLTSGKTSENIPGKSGMGTMPGDAHKNYQSTRDTLNVPKRVSSEKQSAVKSTGSFQGSFGPHQSGQSNNSTNSTLSRQMFLGMVIALPCVPCGMSFAFSSISFDSLRLNVDDASWYASVTPLCFPIGSLVVGKLMDQYGRKPALISITVVNLVGWLMLSVPSSETSLVKLLIGRILTGIACGLASVPPAVYAAECLCPNSVRLRSSLVMWSSVALGIGIFLVNLTGAFLMYYNVASIATLISILALVLVALFIPESPAWLRMKGRYADAEWSEREINVTPPPDLLEEPSASEWEDSSSTPPPPPPPPPISTWKELKKPEVYKPLLIMTGFLFFQQFSGVYVVIAYMVDIIQAAGVVTVKAHWLAVIGGGVILLVSFAASVTYPKTGVRAVATFSGLGTAITLFWIAIYLSLRPLWLNNSSWYFLNWFPVFFILANIALSSAGFLILPWSMLGEVFPLSVRGVAGGLATCMGYIFCFIATKVYPYIQLGLGVAEVFYVFGSMALLGTMYVVAFLPETHGKTLQEIIDEFRKKKTAYKNIKDPHQKPTTQIIIEKQVDQKTFEARV